MMTAHSARPGYVAIWIWLIGLTIFCVGLTLVFGTRPVVVLIFFAVASVKSLLVALNYMHLRFERPLIYAIAIVPVLFVLTLLAALFPDFVFSR
jgi:caa(3)-type oxidase subunit IV